MSKRPINPRRMAIEFGLYMVMLNIAVCIALFK